MQDPEQPAAPARRPQDRLQLAPGVIGSFEIIGNPNERTAFSAVPIRQTLRVEVVGYEPPPDPDTPPPEPDKVRKYATTLEIYNQLLGRTSILLGGPHTLPAATLVLSPALMLLSRRSDYGSNDCHRSCTVERSC